MNNLKKITIAVSSLPNNGWWNNGIVAYHDNDMMSNGAIPNQGLLNEEHKNLLISKIPSGSLGKSEDVTNCVEFLASEKSNYITGETIHVNGGMFMP